MWPEEQGKVPGSVLGPEAGTELEEKCFPLDEVFSFAAYTGWPLLIMEMPNF